MRVCPGPPRVRVSVLYIVRVTPRLTLPGELEVAVAVTVETTVWVTVTWATVTVAVPGVLVEVTVTVVVLAELAGGVTVVVPDCD